MRSTTPVSRRFRTRNASRSRVDRSDQCRSSTTRRTGDRSASRSSSARMCSNSVPWAEPTSSAPAADAASASASALVWPSPDSRSGISRARLARPAPAIRSRSSAGMPRAQFRSASTIGPNAIPPSPTSTHPPDRTSAPSRRARSASSEVRRVLPTPASPDRTNFCSGPVRRPRSRPAGGRARRIGR